MQVIQTQQCVWEQVTPIQTNIGVRWLRNSNCVLVYVPVHRLRGLQSNTSDVYTVNKLDCFKKDAKRLAINCLNISGVVMSTHKAAIQGCLIQSYL